MDELFQTLSAYGDSDDAALSKAHTLERKLPPDIQVIERRLVSSPKVETIHVRAKDDFAAEHKARDQFNDRDAYYTSYEITGVRHNVLSRIGLSRSRDFEVKVSHRACAELRYRLPDRDAAFAGFTARLVAGEHANVAAREIAGLLPDRVLISIFGVQTKARLFDQLGPVAKKYAIFDNKDGDRTFLPDVSARLRRTREPAIVLSAYDPSATGPDQRLCGDDDRTSTVALYLASKTANNWKSVYREQSAGPGRKQRTRCLVFEDLTLAELRDIVRAKSEGKR